jgi:hypothetical protein
MLEYSGDYQILVPVLSDLSSTCREAKSGKTRNSIILDLVRNNPSHHTRTSLWRYFHDGGKFTILAGAGKLSISIITHALHPVRNDFPFGGNCWSKASIQDS